LFWISGKTALTLEKAREELMGTAYSQPEEKIIANLEEGLY
jgi:hypothetical protein